MTKFMDAQLGQIVLLSLRVSGAALFFSSLLGIPAGILLGLNRFPGKRIAIILIYTGMGFPPVVIGLLVYFLLSQRSPLAGLPFLPDLFTPEAMILAQIILAFPLVAGFTMTAVQAVDPALRLQVMALGATRMQAALAVLREARNGVIAAIVAGFGGIISEVGAVMMVGGNIEGRTRVLTTAIVLETRQGNFNTALALSVILLGMAFVVNALLFILQDRWQDA
ncbi:ABC transporter permease [Anaerolinea sp.]|uniref:ABC transporter permease n=1 Tax=Anaerolinea sp. TaxID=1872519 RepID=UPI002ACEECF8|nr:ABC transporter permease [Anaerolinea sp.]